MGISIKAGLVRPKVSRSGKPGPKIYISYRTRFGVVPPGQGSICKKGGTFRYDGAEQPPPHVFIDGKHVGGMFTGNGDSGLAGLKESGKLKDIVDGASIEESKDSLIILSL